MPRGRKSKPKFTYDSKDTRVVIGLVFLFVFGISLFSLFFSAPIFKFFRDLFTNEIATLVFAFFSFNLALAMFKSKFALAQGKSLFGQALFLLAYSAMLQSLWTGAASPVKNAALLPGGIVGNAINLFLSERIFLQTTPIFLFLVILLAIPFILSMSLNRFMEILGGIFLAIFNFFKRIFVKQQAVIEEAVAEQPETEDVQPATVGQLGGKGKLLRIPVGAKPTLPQDDDHSAEERANAMVSSINKKPAATANPKIVVKEGESEDGGAYVNEKPKYPDWQLPPLTLLNDFKKKKPSQENIKRNADVIERTLESFGIRAKVVDVLIGPSVTQYALDLPLGIKVAKIVNLSKDLALSLAIPANSIRLETPIAGTSYIGIEVPNDDRETVFLKEAMADAHMQNNKSNLPIAMGKDIHGELIVSDLQKMPHLLVAGATGSGKSILTNGFIVSMLMTLTPDQVKFIMIDPKQVELSDYNGIPHLLTPVITDMDKVLNALKWAIAEMESRYTMFRESHVKNIESYNELMGYPALPYIVFVIDEMADMMMSTNRVETESGIVRLAQKARATGIHLVLATQRPSVDVITGLIKANIPGRVGMSVTTNIDSRVILDQIGAESLLGKGDMLFKDPAKNKPFRIQGIWVSPEEVQRIVQFIKNQVPEVEYTTKVTEFKDKKDEAGSESTATADVAASGDEKDIQDAIRVLVNAQKGSSSLLQRRLRFGYNKAARIMDEMEELGVVGPANGSKPRDVYVHDAEDFINKTFGGGSTARAEVSEEINNSPYVASREVPGEMGNEIDQ